MPPRGLYSIGRHHIYGGQMLRRSFNSNDFPPEPEPEKPTEGDTAPVQSMGVADDAEGEGEEKRKKKKKKERKSLSKETKPEAVGATETPTITPGVSESKKKRKKAKKEEERAAQEPEASEGRKKKRKRQSEIHVETPTALRNGTANGSFVVGEGLVDNVTASLKGLEAPAARSFETPQTSEKPAKRKKKSTRKSGEGQEKPGEVAQDGQPATPEQPKVKKHKKRKSEIAQQQDIESLPAVMAPRKSPVPLPQQQEYKPIPAVKTPRRTHVPLPQQQEYEPIPAVKTPRRTPIPPPQLSLPSAFNATHQLQQTKHQEPSSSAAVLVPEMPPSKAANKTKSFSKDAVPFPQSQPAPNTTTQRKPSKKERVTVLLSTPASSGDAHTPKSAPAATTKGARPSVPNALTDANLNKHTKPSANGAKPKPRSKGAGSTVTSLPESASTPSILEAFARAGKPYTRSGAVVDPFVLPEAKTKKHRETHEEASMNVFNDKFHDLQKAVNFSEERGYLENYVAWGVEHAADRLPCLGNMTGCTTKKEELLRLSKEENLTLWSHLDTQTGDLLVLKDAANRSRLAAELLMLSLKARVPIPIGRLVGTWTLYCPKYADTHFDRYGYGQRTLTISSIAGFKHRNSYTARLNIPPRPMSYSILAFSTPPHASFRTTTVKADAEGYTMDLIFFGNGYLQLRVDLNLLLRGKATAEVEGKQVHMEFIGVHEKAVRWFDETDELEEEVKKLFAKYDGVGGEE